MLELQIPNDKTPQSIAQESVRRYKPGSMSKENFNVYHYIHVYSNYESVMYDFYLRDKAYCDRHMTSLLVDISNYDKDLVWACHDVKEYYKSLYYNKHQVALEKQRLWKKYVS